MQEWIRVIRVISVIISSNFSIAYISILLALLTLLGLLGLLLLFWQTEHITVIRLKYFVRATSRFKVFAIQFRYQWLKERYIDMNGPFLVSIDFIYALRATWRGYV